MPRLTARMTRYDAPNAARNAIPLALLDVMADEFLKAAIEEAERGLQEGGIPIRLGDGASRTDCSDAAGPIGVFSVEAPCCTARWTRSRTPGGSRRRCIANPCSTRRSRRARCAAAPSCFTASPRSSSARTGRLWRGGAAALEGRVADRAAGRHVHPSDDRLHQGASGSVERGHRA